MKLRNTIIVVFLFSFVFGASFFLTAQSEPWKSYTKEQYLKEKSDYNAQITNLQTDIDKLKIDIPVLNDDLNDSDAKVQKAGNELKSFGDESAFVKDLEKLERIVYVGDNPNVTSQDAEKMLEDLKTQVFKCKYKLRIDKIEKGFHKKLHHILPE